VTTGISGCAGMAGDDEHAAQPLARAVLCNLLPHLDEGRARRRVFTASIAEAYLAPAR